jgi:hypothetical protein
MKNKIIFICGFCLLFIATVALNYSCKKDKETTAEEVTVAQDNAEASSLFDEVFNEVDQAVGQEFAAKAAQIDSACRTITIASTGVNVWPKTITIDFGTEGCDYRANGRIKTGKIVVVLNANPYDSLSTRTITFNNFKINGRLIEGTKTVTYSGIIDGKPTCNVELVGGKVTFNDGTFITRTFNRTRVYEQGFFTKGRYGRWDDVWSIWGQASGVDRKGRAYVELISETNPVYIAFKCKFIQAGEVTLQVEGLPALFFDYGTWSGNITECKREVTITYGDNVKTIDLD